MEKRCYTLLVILSFIFFVNGQTSLECRFDHISVNGGVGYGCDLQNVIIQNENERIRITGQHLRGMTNNDVTRLTILSSNTNFIISRLLAQFPNLNSLEITNGGLQRIQPNAFQTARNLRTLVLQGNNVELLGPNSFAHLFSLETLILRGNNIHIIDPRAFNGLSNLQYLFINNERLRGIQTGTLRTMPNLLMLSLSSNKIRVIDADLIINNRNLHSLFLENNQIMAVHPEFLNNINNVQIISLSSNPCINQVFIPRALSQDNANAMLDTCRANWQ